MKVILLEDVYKKGVAGEVVNVAPGYARNYLIPHKMAVKATPGVLKQLQNLRESSTVRRAERDNEYQEIAEKIEGLELYFGVKAGETGKLYGSVTAGNIADRLEEEIGLKIERRRIGDRPLRELGEFSIPVRLEASLNPLVKVVVFPEGIDPREAAALDAEAEALDAVEAEEAFEEAVDAEVIAEAETEIESFVEETGEENEAADEESAADEPAEDEG